MVLGGNDDVEGDVAAYEVDGVADTGICVGVSLALPLPLTSIGADDVF